jgi:hypothetical protein
MDLLSASDILGVDDSVTRRVPVPEWGGDVIIKNMTGTERDTFEGSLYVDGKMDRSNYRAKALVKVLITEGGARMFTDEQATDFGKRNAGVIDRLYDIAGALSGLSEDGQEAMEGNSAAEGGDASPSTSAAPSEA